LPEPFLTVTDIIAENDQLRDGLRLEESMNKRVHVGQKLKI
jgi:hypothetical protein